MRSRYLSLAWLIVVTWSATIATLAQTSATPSVSTSSDVASPSGKHFPFLQYKLAVHCQHGLVRMEGEAFWHGMACRFEFRPQGGLMASSNATRSTVTAPIAAIFRVNDDLIAKALEGLNAAGLGSVSPTRITQCYG